MPSTAHLRNLVAFLFLVVTGLFLTNHASQRLHRADVQQFHYHKSSSDAGPYGSQAGRDDIPFPARRQRRAKRAVSAQFKSLVCKGKQYWEEGVLPAFDGQSRFPTPTFGDAEDKLADSGWTFRDEPQALPSYWQEVFKSAQGGVPTENLVKVNLNQRSDFSNAFGDQNNAILSILSYSPRFKLGQIGVLEKEIPKKLPRMNQRSDLLWFMWASKTNHPGNLRYFAMDGISNTVTQPLIREILTRWRGTPQVPWAKRVTFDLNSDEGKALFASPNGISVIWFLIHHAAALGRRESRITIFNSDGADRSGENFCMMWDLIPQG
ncbi:MAG: hypothetical protein Q9169_007328 [Polycauliona sp. 2 TL-2023]